MRNTLGGCTERHRLEATIELIAELEEFSHDGLTLLEEDLRLGRVVRGSWAGCVLSYKGGTAGSTRRDRLGRARNALTTLWDAGWYTDEEVLAAVRRELARRRGAAARPSPAPAPMPALAPVATGD